MTRHKQRLRRADELYAAGQLNLAGVNRITNADFLDRYNDRLRDGNRLTLDLLAREVSTYIDNERDWRYPSSKDRGKTMCLRGGRVCMDHRMSDQIRVWEMVEVRGCPSPRGIDVLFNTKW